MDKKFDENCNELWCPGGYIKKISPEEVEKLKKTLNKSYKEDMKFNCKKCGKKISAHNKDWHDNLCDDCFNETYFPEEAESKIKNKKIFMKPGRNNKEDRINFVKFWVNYIKSHKDEEWSKQQNEIINAQIKES